MVSDGKTSRLTQELERLRRRVQELENEVAKLNRITEDAKLQENRLSERANRLEVLSALCLTVTRLLYIKHIHSHRTIDTREVPSLLSQFVFS